MARETINNTELEQVTGGSIVFTPDCTMCGYNCNNQFRVNDFDAALKYIKENKNTMDERSMLKAMMQMGYITRL